MYSAVVSSASLQKLISGQRLTEIPVSISVFFLDPTQIVTDRTRP